MRILIAPDKFKGTLSAHSVAEQIAAGLRDVLPEAELELLPLADGGEGTADMLGDAMGAARIDCEVHNPLGKKMTARYRWVAQTGTAILEMSAPAGAKGLTSLDPLRATTFGVGEMILHAAANGAREIVIGLGGSVTNDGGLGLARALGFAFQGRDGPVVTPGKLIDLEAIIPKTNLSLPKITGAVDVLNPLLGERGATQVFGPQKGATPDQVALLESALTHLANVAARDLGNDFRNEPGAGAAGGLGFGLLAFAGAQLRPGFELVAQAVGLEEKMRRADIVITGEGKLDAQTLEGKTPAGVARLARLLGKRVHAIVGQMENEGAAVALFDGVEALVEKPLPNDYCLDQTEDLLRQRARELAQRL